MQQNTSDWCGAKEVKGFGRYIVDCDGSIYSFVHKKTKKLKPFKNHKGYFMVTLYSDFKTRKDISVHRVVALTFIENPNNYEQVNHINGNKEDNRVVNLEWCTNKQNMDHARENNLIPDKQKKFYEIDYERILNLYGKHKSVRKVAKICKCHHKTVSSFLKSKNKNLSLKMNKFTRDEIDKFLILKAQGWSYRKIAKKYKTNHSTIKRYIDREAKQKTNSEHK